jgi:GNAT superfamily N-acetyltransferase
LAIRLATLDDAALLPDIERSAGALFRAIPDIAWIADDDVMSVEAHLRLINAGTCWVGKDANSRPIAFISAERFAQDLHIWEISVHTSAQGQGIGRHLIETAVNHARQSGISAVTLTTFREIVWNEPYYARLGFETLSEDALSPRLRDILAAEIAHGLPGKRRCAMRLPLKLVSFDNQLKKLQLPRAQ